MANFRTHHIAILSSDPDGLAAFYTERLGLSASKPWSGSGIVFLDAGNTRIELIPREDTGSAQPPSLGQGTGLNHLAFHVDSADETYTDLTRAGVKGLSEPRDFQDIRIAFLSDPEGNVLELVEDRVRPRL